MKSALFFLASLASTQLAAAETAYLRTSTELVEPIDDTEGCLKDCNKKSIDEKGDAKHIEKDLDTCYNDCFYDSDGSENAFTRSLEDGSIDEVLKCTGECAKKAEKEADNIDSKKYDDCIETCEEGDDKCEKKCEDEAEKKAMEDAQKEADHCTTKCVEKSSFEGYVITHAEVKSE